MNQQTILDIKRYGKTAQGRREILKYLQGKRLTRKQAILAHCYGCMGFYVDGKVDCRMPRCPLHPFMAFKTNESKSKND